MLVHRRHFSPTSSHSSDGWQHWWKRPAPVKYPLLLILLKTLQRQQQQQSFNCRSYWKRAKEVCVCVCEEMLHPHFTVTRTWRRGYQRRRRRESVSEEKKRHKDRLMFPGPRWFVMLEVRHISLGLPGALQECELLQQESASSASPRLWRREARESEGGPPVCRNHCKHCWDSHTA